MPTVSLRQYAKKRGGALSSVQKAIASGRIKTEADGRIDAEKADVEWEKNTRTYVPAVTRKGQEEDEGGSFGAGQYTKARAVREHYQARLAKLDYEERIVKLVPKDEVQVAAFNKFRQFRDRLLNVADRVAPMLAAERDPVRCFDILSREIRQALNDFADANN